MSTWGKEDGDRVDILFENGWVRECFVRVDVRILVKGFLVAILHVASEQDLLVITPSLHVSEPTGEAGANDLACSGEGAQGYLRRDPGSRNPSIYFPARGAAAVDAVTTPGSEQGDARLLA
jgi:hypothetical protein